MHGGFRSQRNTSPWGSPAPGEAQPCLAAATFTHVLELGEGKGLEPACLAGANTPLHCLGLGDELGVGAQPGAAGPAARRSEMILKGFRAAAVRVWLSPGSGEARALWLHPGGTSRVDGATAGGSARLSARHPHPREMVLFCLCPHSGKLYSSRA